MTCPTPSSLSPLGAHAKVAAVFLTLAMQLGCVSGGMNQLASPGSIEDMQTILSELALDERVGQMVQEVVDVAGRNLPDDTLWIDRVNIESRNMTVRALPALAARGIVLTPDEEDRVRAAVHRTLTRLAVEVPPPSDHRVRTALALALATGVGEPLHFDLVDALEKELAAQPDAGVATVIAGRVPFARVMGREFAMGLVDGLSTADPAIFHRFLATERSAFGNSTEATLQGWSVSFWWSVTALLFGGLVVAFLVRRDILLHRKNARTLRFLAGTLRAREADPAMRELLSALADPADPRAGRHLQDYADDRPDPVAPDPAPDAPDEPKPRVA